VVTDAINEETFHWQLLHLST